MERDTRIDILGQELVNLFTERDETDKLSDFMDLLNHAVNVGNVTRTENSFTKELYEAMQADFEDGDCWPYNEAGERS